MSDTDQISIIQLMSVAMSRVQSIGKGGFNDSQKYNFRGIDQVMNAVGPVFRDLGIVAVPYKTAAHYRDVQTSTGKPAREATVVVGYRFYGPAGDYIDAEVPGEAMDSGDKGTPKAMSVAFRTCLLQALCIPTDEPDPDSMSYERATPAEPVRETDLLWMEDFDNRVAAATTVGEVRGLWSEYTTVWREGRISTSDKVIIEKVLKARSDDLAAMA